MKQLRIWTADRHLSINKIAIAEQKLITLSDNVVKDAKRVNPEQLKLQISHAAKNILRDQDWPDEFWPMPSIKVDLGCAYKAAVNPEQAIFFSIQGYYNTSWRARSFWVKQLFRLTQVFAPVVQDQRKEPLAAVLVFMSADEWWDLYYGLWYELRMQSRKAFGVDTALSKAVEECYQPLTRSSDVQLSSTAFSKCFEVAQVKLLAWAGIDKGRKIVLSRC